jgi:hypothetical protein
VPNAPPWPYVPLEGPASSPFPTPFPPRHRRGKGSLRKLTRNSLCLRRARWDRRSLFVVCRLVATLRSTTGHTRRWPVPPAVPLQARRLPGFPTPFPPRHRRGKGAALISASPRLYRGIEFLFDPGCVGLGKGSRGPAPPSASLSLMRIFAAHREAGRLNA